MYILQKRDSEKSHWHTCSFKGKKCKFEDLAKARTAYRLQKNSEEAKKYPNRQYRILDSQTDEEVK